MSLKAELKKIQKSIGLDKPCLSCRLTELRAARWKELEEKFDAALRMERPEARKKQKQSRLTNHDDYIYFPCQYCGRLKGYVYSGETPDDRVMEQRYWSLQRQGLSHAPEYKEIVDSYEAFWRRTFEDSETDNKIQEIVDKAFRPLREMLDKTKKRFPYICRVDDCEICGKNKQRW